MEDLLQSAIETAAEEALGQALPAAKPLVFIAITLLGLVMALVYVPIRVYLTVTARSRRLRLLQRIRKLRDELSPSAAPERQPAPAEPSTSALR